MKKTKVLVKASTFTLEKSSCRIICICLLIICICLFFEDGVHFIITSFLRGKCYLIYLEIHISILHFIFYFFLYMTDFSFNDKILIKP